MLCLLFSVKGTQFVVDTSYVVEVIHKVDVADPVASNTQFEGLINYRGNLIPLLDFCYFYSGIPAEPYLNSRIIILESLDERRIGLLAEGVVDTIQISRSEYLENPIDGKSFAYISGLWSTKVGIMKNLDVPLLFDMCHGATSYGSH